MLDTAKILKFGLDGNINVFKSITPDTGINKSSIFGNELIRSLVKLSGNCYAIQYLIFDEVTYVDSNFIPINEDEWIYNKDFLHLRRDLKSPKISRANDSIIYASGFEAKRSWDCKDHAIMKGIIRNKELFILNNYLVSFPEQYCKESHFISSVFKDRYFVCSLPSGAVLNDIRSIKNEFYVSFMSDTNEIWHKSYGGEYAFIVTGLNSIDSCNVLVTGAIYDYFKNGYIQQFYTIIDCNGNIVNSNIDIKEVEPSMVYPNPAKDIIHLKTDLDIRRLELYDLQGRIIRTEKGQFLKKMNSQEIPTGTYLLKIYYNGKYKTERILIMND